MSRTNAMRGRRPAKKHLAPKYGFVNGPSDPPSTVISPWKFVKLAIQLQPGSVSEITSALLKTEITNNFGVTPTCFKLVKVQVWSMSGVAGAQSRPSIRLNPLDPTTGGSFGQRSDYGSVGTPAHLHFTYPPHIQATPIAFPSTAVNLSDVEIFESAGGVMTITVGYMMAKV